MKRCFYEVLGVERKATPDDIKIAYRKLAIKYHPDKNDSEDATKIFQEINEANSVLSDPNERSWYDNHRDQILNNQPDGPMDEKEMEMNTFGVNIWSYFTSSCYSGFGDDEKGFYSVYRNLFEILKGQEERAKDDHSESDDEDPSRNLYKAGKDAPGFGDSKTSIERVEGFYKYWEHFTTLKKFRWADTYNETQAPNRQVKRLMHKENNKERNKEKKKFHETMRSLVEYVKKRDPRYQDYIKNKLLEKQKKIEEDKRLQEEKKKEKAESRKRQREEEALRYEQEYREKKERGEVSEEEDVVTGENVHYEDFFCDICDKEFKTENQLLNHLNSKAHIKKHKQLMDEVMLEEEKQEIETQKENNNEKEDEIEPPQQTKSKKKNKKKKNKAKNKTTEDEQSSVSEKQSSKKQEPKAKDKETKKEEEVTPKAKESQSDDDNDNDDDIDLQAFSKLRTVRNKNAGEKNTTNEPQEEEEETKQPAKNWNQSKFFQMQDDDDTNLQVEDKNGDQNQESKTDRVDGSEGDEEDEAVLIGMLPSKKSQKKKEKKKKKFQNIIGEEPSEKEVFQEPVVSKASDELKKENKVAVEQNVVQESKENKKENDKEPTKKMNAAKLKKIKKKEKELAEESFICNVCKESFSTRNKLFQHVKDKGHELTGEIPQTKSKKT